MFPLFVKTHKTEMRTMNSIAVKSIAALVLLSTLSTKAEVPEIPLPNGNKFAIELFKIESPAPFEPETFIKSNISIPELFEQESNKIHGYPTLYSTMGDSAICDQTKSVRMAENYNVKDGKTVPVEKTFVLGMLAEVTITKLQNNVATYKLDFSYNELQGYNDFNLKKDLVVQIPYFETRKINTELSQSLGSWLVLGGFSDNGEDGIHSTYYVIRITRPVNRY